MQSSWIRSVAILIAGLLFVASVGSAQSPGGTGSASGQQPAETEALRQQIEQLRRDFDSLQRQYADRLSALEARLQALEGQTASSAPPMPPAVPAQAAAPPAVPPAPTVAVPAGAEGAGGPGGVLPVYGAATAGSKIFNPDIAVIGNALGTAGTNDVSPGPGLEMREAEISMQAIVDPYARADFFFAVGPEGAAVEEGYITFPTLPAGVLMKVGKMKAAFGKVNTLHPHLLPWTDQPLVIANLVGGEEGLNDAGVSVARLIPNRWLFLEATGQVFRGDSGPDTLPIFRASRRSDVSYLGHLRANQDLSESSNLDFGVSLSRGHNAAGLVDGVDVGRFTTSLIGVDATFRWRPLRRSIYRSFVGRSELVWSRRDQFDGLQRSMGYFVSGDYQFARRWFAGARYDRSDRADNARLTDRGGSVALTFWPSEFSQVRGQFRQMTYAEGPTANEFLFQVQFAIGAHGAHPF